MKSNKSIKILGSLCLLFILSLSSYAQNNLLIKSNACRLQKRYIRDTDLTDQNPRLVDQFNIATIHKYCIPPKVFLSSYPFNADSVVVYLTNICKPSPKFHRLERMNQIQIADFADILYNYNFTSKKEKEKSDYLRVTSVSGQTPANFEPFLRIYFYHKKSINYIGFYYHEGFPPIRFESTFDKSRKHLKRNETYPFWGWGYFSDDFYIRLSKFFDKNFKFNIIKKRRDWFLIHIGASSE